MSPNVRLCSLLSACEASLLRVFSTQTQLQPEEAEDRDWLCFYRAGQGFDGGGSCGRVAARPALTCAMLSGSRGLPPWWWWWWWASVKPVYCPEEVERRIGGLSIFFSDSWRLMLVRLPWPVRRRRSGLSMGMWLRLRSMSLGLKWPRTGEPISGVPPWPCWEVCTMQWTSLGRAGGRRDGGSDLFLCLLG